MLRELLASLSALTPSGTSVPGVDCHPFASVGTAYTCYTYIHTSTHICIDKMINKPLKIIIFWPTEKYFTL